MYGDQASSEGDTNKTPPARERLVETREPKTGMEALLEQQAAMMTLMMQQMKDLNARVEVAEETAAKAASQAGSSAQSGDAELEQLKKLPYVPHVAGNLFPTRPPTLETDMPQMYGLYNDETYDALFKRTNSSMGYEQLVLAPALSYMHVAIASSEVALGWLQGEKEPPGVEDLGERVYTAHNTLKGVFALLINRYTMIQLRASMESDATTRGGAEALRAKPAFVEEKVYAGSDGLVTNSILTKWLKEFDTKKAKAVTNTPAKATAKASAKVSTFRDRQEEKAKTQRAVELERVKVAAAAAKLVEHLGLEVDLKAGQFRVTPARLQKIHLQTKALLREALRQRRWLPARKFAAFAGHCQSVYLAVLPARLYLRELHFVISTKRGWGAKLKLTRQAGSDIKWHAARGFWLDELRHLHITRLELEAVYKTVQSFLRELTGKVARLYCDNLADGRRAAGHNPWAGVVRGCKVRVYWPTDDTWYTGTVDGVGA
eukprot:gene34171-biopygen18144